MINCWHESCNHPKQVLTVEISGWFFMSSLVFYDLMLRSSDMNLLNCCNENRHT